MRHIINRSNRQVSVKEFAKAGVPAKVDELSVVCPFDELYVLRMPIRINGECPVIPECLDWAMPLILTAIRNQSRYMKVQDFIYVTVRHGKVRSETDDEWHVDGFSTKVAHVPEQNYIWTNHNPTEYADIKVDFPEDFDPLVHNVNTYLQQFVNEDNVVQAEENGLYLMDPYILHRRPTSAFDQMRTFFRISFVPIEINDVNNTQNPLMPVDHYTNDGVQTRNALIDY